MLDLYFSIWDVFTMGREPAELAKRAKYQSPAMRGKGDFNGQ